MEMVLSSDYPENLYWYILNNGTGESVGPSLSLPLSPWHYELARVIHTRTVPPGTFKPCRINATGLKFEPVQARTLAKKHGQSPRPGAFGEADPGDEVAGLVTTH